MSTTQLQRRVHLGAVYVFIALAGVAMAASAAAGSRADYRPRPDNAAINKANLKQRLDHQIPPDLTFQTSKGQSIDLSAYFDGDRPIILALGYVQCPNLCTLVHESMVQSLEEIDLDMGADYQVLSVSIEPNEPLDLTRSARQRYLQMYGRRGAGDGWHSLVGHKPAVAALSKAVGFTYAYDQKKDEYAHPAALMVLTPDGKISRYFYGIKYDPTDLKLGLMDASHGDIGSPVDQILLRCCSYDPSTGKYSLAIMNVLRLAGLATVVFIAAAMAYAMWRQRDQPDPSTDCADSEA